jgi:hypothetical protein
MFRSLGISTIEIGDIDEEPDEQQLARLDRYDALYFTGGDPGFADLELLPHLNRLEPAFIVKVVIRFRDVVESLMNAD